MMLKMINRRILDFLDFRNFKFLGKYRTLELPRGMIK